MDDCIDFNDLMRAAEAADAYGVKGTPARIFRDSLEGMYCNDWSSDGERGEEDDDPFAKQCLSTDQGDKRLSQTTALPFRDVPSSSTSEYQAFDVVDRVPDDAELVREIIRAALSSRRGKEEMLIETELEEEDDTNTGNGNDSKNPTASAASEDEEEDDDEGADFSNDEDNPPGDRSRSIVQRHTAGEPQCSDSDSDVAPGDGDLPSDRDGAALRTRAALRSTGERYVRGLCDSIPSCANADTSHASSSLPGSFQSLWGREDSDDEHSPHPTRLGVTFRDFLLTLPDCKRVQAYWDALSAESVRRELFAAMAESGGGGRWSPEPPIPADSYEITPAAFLAPERSSDEDSEAAAEDWIACKRWLHARCCQAALPQDPHSDPRCYETLSSSASPLPAIGPLDLPAEMRETAIARVGSADALPDWARRLAVYASFVGLRATPAIAHTFPRTLYRVTDRLRCIRRAQFVCFFLTKDFTLDVTAARDERCWPPAKPPPGCSFDAIDEDWVVSPRNEAGVPAPICPGGYFPAAWRPPSRGIIQLRPGADPRSITPDDGLDWCDYAAIFSRTMFFKVRHGFVCAPANYCGPSGVSAPPTFGFQYPSPPGKMPPALAAAVAESEAALQSAAASKGGERSRSTDGKRKRTRDASPSASFWTDQLAAAMNELNLPAAVSAIGPRVRTLYPAICQWRHAVEVTARKRFDASNRLRLLSIRDDEEDEDPDAGAAARGGKRRNGTPSQHPPHTRADLIDPPANCVRAACPMFPPLPLPDWGPGARAAKRAVSGPAASRGRETGSAAAPSTTAARDKSKVGRADEARLGGLGVGAPRKQASGSRPCRPPASRRSRRSPSRSPLRSSSASSSFSSSSSEGSSSSDDSSSSEESSSTSGDSYHSSDCSVSSGSRSPSPTPKRPGGRSKTKKKKNQQQRPEVDPESHGRRKKDPPGRGRGKPDSGEPRKTGRGEGRGVGERSDESDRNRKGDARNKRALVGQKAPRTLLIALQNVLFNKPQQPSAKPSTNMEDSVAAGEDEGTIASADNASGDADRGDDNVDGGSAITATATAAAACEPMETTAGDDTDGVAGAAAARPADRASTPASGDAASASAPEGTSVADRHREPAATSKKKAPSAPAGGKKRRRACVSDEEARPAAGGNAVSHSSSGKKRGGAGGGGVGNGGTGATGTNGAGSGGKRLAGDVAALPPDQPADEFASEAAARGMSVGECGSAGRELLMTDPGFRALWLSLTSPSAPAEGGPIVCPSRSSDAGPWPGSEPPPPDRVRYGGTGFHREALTDCPEIRSAMDRYARCEGPVPVFVAEMGDSAKQYDSMVKLIYRAGKDPMSWLQNGRLGEEDQALEDYIQRRFQNCRGGSGSYITGNVARSIPHVGDAMAAGNVLWGLPHVTAAVAMSRRYDRCQKGFLLHSLRRAYAHLAFPGYTSMVCGSVTDDAADALARVAADLEEMSDAVTSGRAASQGFRCRRRAASAGAVWSGLGGFRSDGSPDPPPMDEVADACVLACDSLIAVAMEGPDGPAKVAEALASAAEAEQTELKRLGTRWRCPPEMLHKFSDMIGDWIGDLRLARDCLIVSRMCGEYRSQKGAEGRLAAAKTAASVASVLAPYLRGDVSRAASRASSWDLTTALFSASAHTVSSSSASGTDTGGGADATVGPCVAKAALKKASSLFGGKSGCDPPLCAWPTKRRVAPAGGAPRSGGRARGSRSPQRQNSAVQETPSSVAPQSKASAPQLGSRKRRSAGDRPSSSASAAADPPQIPRSELPPTAAAADAIVVDDDDEEADDAGGDGDAECMEIPADEPTAGERIDGGGRGGEVVVSAPPVPPAVRDPDSSSAEGAGPPPAKRRSDGQGSSRPPPPSSASLDCLVRLRRASALVGKAPPSGRHPRGGYRRQPSGCTHTECRSADALSAYFDPATTAALIDDASIPSKWRPAAMFDPAALTLLADDRRRALRSCLWMRQIDNPEDVRVLILFNALPGEQLFWPEGSSSSSSRPADDCGDDDDDYFFGDSSGPAGGSCKPVWSDEKGGLSAVLSALSNRVLSPDSHSWAGNWTGPPDVSALNSMGVMFLCVSDLAFSGAVEYLCSRLETARRPLIVLNAVDPEDWPEDGPTIGAFHGYVKAKVSPRFCCRVRWPRAHDLRRVVLCSPGTLGPSAFGRVETMYANAYPESSPLRLCRSSNVRYMVPTRAGNATFVPMPPRDYRDMVLPMFDSCKDMAAQAAGLGLNEPDFKHDAAHGHRAANRWGLGAPLCPLYVTCGRKCVLESPDDLPTTLREVCRAVVLEPDGDAGPVVLDARLPPDRLADMGRALISRSLCWPPGDGPSRSSLEYGSGDVSEIETVSPLRHSSARSLSGAATLRSAVSPASASSSFSSYRHASLAHGDPYYQNHDHYQQHAHRSLLPSSSSHRRRRHNPVPVPLPPNHDPRQRQQRRNGRPYRVQADFDSMDTESFRRRRSDSAAAVEPASASGVLDQVTLVDWSCDDRTGAAAAATSSSSSSLPRRPRFLREDSFEPARDPARYRYPDADDPSYDRRIRGDGSRYSRYALDAHPLESPRVRRQRHRPFDSRPPPHPSASSFSVSSRDPRIHRHPRQRGGFDVYYSESGDDEEDVDSTAADYGYLSPPRSPLHRHPNLHPPLSPSPSPPPARHSMGSGGRRRAPSPDRSSESDSSSDSGSCLLTPGPRGAGARPSIDIGHKGATILGSIPSPAAPHVPFSSSSSSVRRPSRGSCEHRQTRPAATTDGISAAGRRYRRPAAAPSPPPTSRRRRGEDTLYLPRVSVGDDTSSSSPVVTSVQPAVERHPRTDVNNQCQQGLVARLPSSRPAIASAPSTLPSEQPNPNHQPPQPPNRRGGLNRLAGDRRQTDRISATSANAGTDRSAAFGRRAAESDGDLSCYYYSSEAEEDDDDDDEEEAVAASEPRTEGSVLSNRTIDRDDDDDDDDEDDEEDANERGTAHGHEPARPN